MLELVLTFLVFWASCLRLEMVLSGPKSLSALVDSVVEDNRKQLTVYKFPVYYVTHIFLRWHFFFIALPGLCCVIFGKLDSSALINNWVVEDVEHSVANVNEFSFALKLFNKSLRCTKNILKVLQKKKLASWESQNGRAKLLKTREEGFNSVKYHWAATEHPPIKTFFAWAVSGFYGEKKNILDRFVGL